MITLKSLESKALVAKGIDGAGNVVDLPTGSQCNWSVGDPALLEAIHDIIAPPQFEVLRSIGPVGSASVLVSVVLPDQRTLVGTELVEVTVGDVVSIVIVVG